MVHPLLKTYKSGERREDGKKNVLPLDTSQHQEASDFFYCEDVQS
jgi:hypothetical protein